jgi:Flp pilus assembly protein TadG
MMAARHQSRSRRGVATVEFAVAAPLFVLLLVGIWEVGRMVEVQQILKNAVREGGRQAANGTQTTSDVQQTVLNYLTQAGINTSGATVTVTNLTAGSRSDPTTALQMDHFQVTLTLPFDNVRWVFLNQITGIRTLNASADWFCTKDAPASVSMTIPIN